MVNRILEQQQPLCATLIEIRKPELMPTDTEISTMEAFVDVMKPIVEITEKIGGEKQVTFSAVRPLIYKLLTKYLCIAPEDSHVKKQIKKTVKADLENRYQDPQVEEVMNKACFLDPRFKSLSFLPEVERRYITSLVEEETGELRQAACEDVAESTSTESEPQKKKSKKGLFSLLEDLMDSPSLASDNPQEAAKKEIQQYLTLDASSADNPIDPVKWWKTYCVQLPFLSSLARKYLCIPATSVPSERAFSVSGNIITSKRSCLHPENAEMLTFLAHNLKNS